MHKFTVGMGVGIFVGSRTVIGLFVAIALPLIPWILLSVMHSGEWLDHFLWREVYNRAKQ